MNAIRLGLTGAVLVVAVSTAAPAGATLAADDSAADLVATLQQQGYSVQINGSVDVPLTLCRVTDVHGLTNTVRAIGSTTAYIDVSCASDN